MSEWLSFFLGFVSGVLFSVIAVIGGFWKAYKRDREGA